MSKTKLNVGCGKNILGDWVNLDKFPGPGVDVVADLDSLIPASRKAADWYFTRQFDDCLPFEDDSIDEFLLSHILEHLKNPLIVMEEMHRIAKPGAKCLIRVPYGSSDDAWEDPTHLRPYFKGSFSPFSQSYYWRADYGYRGDWEVEQIELIIEKKFAENKTAEEVLELIEHKRNCVLEMIATLVCIKPIRPANRDLQKILKVSFTLI